MNQKGLVPLLIVIILAALVGGYLIYQRQIVGNGFLEGNVTIGPLCPLEPCNLTSEQITKTYESRKLLVYDANNQSRLIKEINIDSQGNYKAELAPGTYIIKIKSPNILESGRSGKSPNKAKVEAGKSTTLDITIDTGIR